MSFLKKISLETMKNSISDVKSKATESLSNIDIKDVTRKINNKVIEIGDQTTESAKNFYNITSEKVADSYDLAKEKAQQIDYSKFKDFEFYQSKTKEYLQLSSEKISGYFYSTFEVNKETIDIVDDIKSRLPVRPDTVDDIFEQCKKEAIRRAIASFALGNLMTNIDNRSEEKYSNLSQEYKEWYSENSYEIQKSGTNYSKMQDIRDDAKKSWDILEDGYNKSNILYPTDADIEHVISKKEYFSDFLIKIGTTDKELSQMIDSEENLVFTSGSFNRSLRDKKIYDYINKKGSINPDNPDLIDIEINGVVHSVSRNDIDEAYNTAEGKRQENRTIAIKEVGITVAKTGAYMATQQIVGLIVVETIDIFIDEIKEISKNGNIIDDGVIKFAKDSKDRIHEKLSVRFEERDLWRKAKEVGVESGISGALSIIPQIIISTILKLPSLILAIIRESTLSIVRCVRVLLGDDDKKLDSIKIIIAGTAAAIIGVYVNKVISTAISSVPLLNKFNRQITEILTGLLITAIPLVAIYTFEKNKRKFIFAVRKISSNNE